MQLPRDYISFWNPTCRKNDNDEDSNIDDKANNVDNTEILIMCRNLRKSTKLSLPVTYFWLKW